MPRLVEAGDVDLMNVREGKVLKLMDENFVVAIKKYRQTKVADDVLERAFIPNR